MRKFRVTLNGQSQRASLLSISGQNVEVGVEIKTGCPFLCGRIFKLDARKKKSECENTVCFLFVVTTTSSEVVIGLASERFSTWCVKGGTACVI